MTDYEKSVSDSLATMAKSFDRIANSLCTYLDENLRVLQERKKLAEAETEKKIKEISQMNNTNDTEVQLKEQALREREISVRERELNIREAELDAE